MDGIRIEPSEGGRVLLLDVICKCGTNCLRNAATGQQSFKHAIGVGEGERIELVCPSCSANYEVYAQTGHVHVNNLPRS